METTITQLRLKELFNYDKTTGIFTRAKDLHIGGFKKGSVAGSTDKHGYTVMSVDMRQYKAHRLAWLYMYGELPKRSLDHINHNRADNRIINLREATHEDNAKNSNLSEANTSGYTGVSFLKRTKRWRARIFNKGIDIHLGYFSTKEDAISARKAADVKYGFHENHGKEIYSISQFNY